MARLKGKLVGNYRNTTGNDTKLKLKKCSMNKLVEVKKKCNQRLAKNGRAFFYITKEKKKKIGCVHLRNLINEEIRSRV